MREKLAVCREVVQPCRHRGLWGLLDHSELVHCIFIHTSLVPRSFGVARERRQPLAHLQYRFFPGGGEPENEATCTHCTDMNSSLLQPEFCTVHFTCCSCSFPQKPAAWVGVGCGWNNRPPLGEKATAHAKNKKKTKQALSDASVEQAPVFFYSKCHVI